MKNAFLIKEIAQDAADEPKKRRGRAKPKAVEPEPTREPVEFEPPALRPSLGRIDDAATCADSTCRGTSFDVLDEEMHDITGLGFSQLAWRVECCLCGTVHWMKAVPNHLAKAKDEFRFRDGLFAGLTVAEAAGKTHGMEYLAWAASSHPRQAVRDAVKKCVDELKITR